MTPGDHRISYIPHGAEGDPDAVHAVHIGTRVASCGVLVRAASDRTERFVIGDPAACAACESAETQKAQA